MTDQKKEYLDRLKDVGSRLSKVLNGKNLGILFTPTGYFTSAVGMTLTYTIAVGASIFLNIHEISLMLAVIVIGGLLAYIPWKRVLDKILTWNKST